MFLDWLGIYQDHEGSLPIIADRHEIVVDTATGEDLGIKQPTVQHEGSFSTSINIRISGNRVTVTGNPSRVNRIENLFGLTTVDQCVSVYNQILATYNLPPFTKATKTWFGVGKDGTKVNTFHDGATITELHLTTNKTVGSGNEDDYIKALSTQPYRNSIPRLHSNGKTCDWLTRKGNGSSLIYPSCYNKANELRMHSLAKLKRKHGEDSEAYQYLLKVINFCESQGVVRMEQKFKSAYLRRNRQNIYGAQKFDQLRAEHDRFLALDEKIKVEAMDLQTITQKLTTELGLTTRAANITTIYVINWMHGQTFDNSKSQSRTHRARLRKIGIDIDLPCDLTKFSLVTARASRKVTVGHLQTPTWYQRPANTAMRAVA